MFFGTARRISTLTLPGWLQLKQNQIKIVVLMFHACIEVMSIAANLSKHNALKFHASKMQNVFFFAVRMRLKETPVISAGPVKPGETAPLVSPFRA